MEALEGYWQLELPSVRLPLRRGKTRFLLSSGPFSPRVAPLGQLRGHGRRVLPALLFPRPIIRICAPPISLSDACDVIHRPPFLSASAHLQGDNDLSRETLELSRGPRGALHVVSCSSAVPHCGVKEHGNGSAHTNIDAKSSSLSRSFECFLVASLPSSRDSFFPFIPGQPVWAVAIIGLLMGARARAAARICWSGGKVDVLLERVTSTAAAFPISPHLYFRRSSALSLMKVPRHGSTTSKSAGSRRMPSLFCHPFLPFAPPCRRRRVMTSPSLPFAGAGGKVFAQAVFSRLFDLHRFFP